MKIKIHNSLFKYSGENKSSYFRTLIRFNEEVIGYGGNHGDTEMTMICPSPWIFYFAWMLYHETVIIMDMETREEIGEFDLKP